MLEILLGISGEPPALRNTSLIRLMIHKKEDPLSRVLSILRFLFSEVPEVHNRCRHAPEVCHHIRHLENILEVAVY